MLRLGGWLGLLVFCAVSHAADGSNETTAPTTSPAPSMSPMPTLSQVPTLLPTTAPTVLLESFDLDMTYGMITLEFSETMRGNTFDVTQVSLQANVSKTSGNYIDLVSGDLARSKWRAMKNAPVARRS